MPSHFIYLCPLLLVTLCISTIALLLAAMPIIHLTQTIFVNIEVLELLSKVSLRSSSVFSRVFLIFQFCIYLTYSSSCPFYYYILACRCIHCITLLMVKFIPSCDLYFASMNTCMLIIISQTSLSVTLLIKHWIRFNCIFHTYQSILFYFRIGCKFLLFCIASSLQRKFPLQSSIFSAIATVIVDHFFFLYMVSCYYARASVFKLKVSLLSWLSVVNLQNLSYDFSIAFFKFLTDFFMIWQ